MDKEGAWFEGLARAATRLRRGHGLYALFVVVLSGLASVVGFAFPDGVFKMTAFSVIVVAVLVAVFASPYFLGKMPASEETTVQMAQQGFWVKYIGDEPKVIKLEPGTQRPPEIPPPDNGEDE